MYVDDSSYMLSLAYSDPPMYTRIKTASQAVHWLTKLKMYLPFGYFTTMPKKRDKQTHGLNSYQILGIHYFQGLIRKLEG